MSEPALRHLRENLWVLIAPFAFELPSFTITVPFGYVFDLASIPRPLWALLAPFELSTAAPLLHDFLYSHCGRPPATSCSPVRTFGRFEADWLFLEVMRREGVAGWRRRAAFVAVRLVGWVAWRRHAAAARRLASQT